MAFAGGVLFTPPRGPIPFWEPQTVASSLTDDSPTPNGEGPTYMDNPWDTVLFNGKKLPGVCRVKALPTLRFDKKKPGGSDGLTLTSQGYLPGPVEIEVTLYTADQWTIFQALASEIWNKPTRGGKAKPIDISHPGTDLWGIKSIVIEGVSVPESGPAPQSMVIKIKGFEFLPPTGKATNTPKASGKLPVKKELRRETNAGGQSPGQNQTGPTGVAKK